MCDDVCPHSCEWSFHIFWGHKTALERGFMAASFPSSCCFYSDKGSSEEAFFCICQIPDIFISMFMAIPGFEVGPILPLIS